MRKLSGIMFDRRDHGLLTIVNDVLNRDKSQEYNKRKFYPHFHPNGIKKLAESRGLRIAYAVIHLLESLDAGKQDERLGALRVLRDEGGAQCLGRGHAQKYSPGATSDHEGTGSISGRL